MFEVKHCPACGGESWQVVDLLEYRESDTVLDRYTQIRLEVLFTVWLPNVDSVRLKSVLCKECGFLCYSPRPSESDLIKKYEYLDAHPEASKEFTQLKATDKVRSSEAYHILRPYLSKKSQSHSILDFGGGNGRLLSKFLERGYSCAIIELADSLVDERIQYLGPSLSSITADRKFDTVLMSHVLEHLNDPYAVLCKLRKFLSENSQIYVEVPCEIWRASPPKKEPVTHINYFTKNSMQTLLERSGYMVLMCKHSTFTRPNGYIGLAVKAIARPRPHGTTRNPTLKGPNLTYSLIKPSISRRFFRALMHPRLILNVFKR